MEDALSADLQRLSPRSSRTAEAGGDGLQNPRKRRTIGAGLKTSWSRNRRPALSGCESPRAPPTSPSWFLETQRMRENANRDGIQDEMLNSPPLPPLSAMLVPSPVSDPYEICDEILLMRKAEMQGKAVDHLPLPPLDLSGNSVSDGHSVAESMINDEVLMMRKAEIQARTAPPPAPSTSVERAFDEVKESVSKAYGTNYDNQKGNALPEASTLPGLRVPVHGQEFVSLLPYPS